MKIKTIVKVCASVMGLTLITGVTFGVFLRPVEIVVDSSSWVARGASSIDSISVKAYPKGTPEFQRPDSGTTVGVLFYQDAGAISLNRAPDPLKSGTMFTLTSDESIVEAKSKSGVVWVYEITINQ